MYPQKKKKAKNTKSCNVIVVVFLNYPNDVFRVKIHFSDIKAYRSKLKAIILSSQTQIVWLKIARVTQ